MLLILRNNLSHGLVIGSILASIVLVLSAVLFYVFEKDTNPNVGDIGAGFLWVTRTLLQQEPPFEPTTGMGSLLFYVVVVTGVGIIVIATGAIATRLIEWVMRRDAGMGRVKYEDHIVLCGWNPKGDEILRELHGDEVLDKRPVAIVAPLSANPTDDDLTTFIKGSPSDSDALRRAGIERAESAIILADDSDPGTNADQRDAMTLMTTLAVESLNPTVHTCVEVIKSENLPHFSRAKADEIVVSAELAGNILAASAVTHGLSGVIADLTGHANGSEFYSFPTPSRLTGKSFQEALEVLKSQANALLVGVARNGHRYELNPDSDRVLDGDDTLLVIASVDPAHVLRERAEVEERKQVAN